MPEREQRHDPAAGQSLLPIGAHVAEEQVPEDQVLDTVIPGRRHGRGHLLLIDDVRARPRQLDHPHRQAQRVGLGLEQHPTDRMHGHPVRR